MSHTDWEMFCRGRPSADDGPVPLEPEDSDEPTTGAAVRHVTTRIVGIPYPNPDGTGRRDAVRALGRLDRVQLVHRPDNPVDRNAVAVLRHPDGHQLGYLPAAHAADVVAAARERGTRFLALVPVSRATPTTCSPSAWSAPSCSCSSSKAARPARWPADTCWGS